MGYQIPANITTYPLYFQLFLAGTRTPATGKSPTVTICKRGASFGSPAGSVSEVANGWYAVAGHASDTDTIGPLLLHATAAACDPADEMYEVVGASVNAPYLGIDALLTGQIFDFWNFDASAEGDYDSGSFGNRVNQVFHDADDYLNYSLAAIAAFIDTEIAAIKAKTDTIPASPAAVGSAMTLTSGERTSIADALLDRNMATGTDSGGRTVRNALRLLRNKFTVVAGTLSVKKEDDSTEAWNAAVSTTAGSNPVTGVDPS